MRDKILRGGRTFTFWESPVGWLGLVSGARGLIEIIMQPEKMKIFSRLDEAFPQAVETAGPDAAIKQIEQYFRGERRQFQLELDFGDLSPFTGKVLRLLPTIAFGSTVTYGELATRAGHPGAARAIGRAMAVNPFPLVLPCHRVVGAGGRLTGYSSGAGITTKSWLLDFECSRTGGPAAGKKY